MAATYDGSIRINTKIDQAGAQAGLKTLTASLKNFALTVGAAFAVGAIVSFSKSCISLASDLNEVQNVIDTTFGSSVGLIEQFAKTAATSFGLSELAAKQYTGTMGAMLKSMGFTQEAAADMSIEMASLAGDMASFYNLSTDEAFEKIRSGISGETEPLKQLGVNLSVANLQAYALAQGMTTAYDSLSEQNKALLRYNYLLDVTSDAQGDFAKTSNSWANQVRILKLQWDSFKATLGGAFIQVLTPVLQMLNVLIGRLNSAATVFASFIAAITGNTQQVTTATTEATDAVDGLADSTIAAGTAAKKASGGLASFDDLSTLPDSSGGSGSGAGASTVSETTATTDAVDDTTKSLEKFKSAFDFANLQKSLAGLKESFLGFKESIGSGLKWLYDNILVPLAQWTIEDALPVFLDVLAGALDLLTAVIEALKPMAIWLWDNFLEPIAAWTGGVIVSVLGLIATALSKISDWAKVHQTTIQIMTTTVLAFMAAWKVVEILSFIQISGGVVGALATITTAIKACTVAKIADKAETLALQIMYAGDFVKSIGSIVVKKAEELTAWVASTTAKVADKAETLALQALYAKDFIVSLALVIASKGKELAAFIASTAAKIADTAATTIATAATTAFSVALAFLAANPIVLVIAAIVALVAGIVLLITHWDTVKAKAIEVWDGIVAVWGTVAAWFANNVVTPIVTAFETIKAKVLGIWNDLWDGMKGIINDYLISGIEGFINAIIDGIQLLVSALNKIHIDVPKWAYKLTDVRSFGFDLQAPGNIKIPRLAQGAVIPPNREFIATLGDQKSGRNLEAPEDLIRQIFREESGSGSGETVIRFEGSMGQLIRVLKPYIDKENNRKGKIIIKGAPA